MAGEVDRLVEAAREMRRELTCLSHPYDGERIDVPNLDCCDPCNAARHFDEALSTLTPAPATCGTCGTAPPVDVEACARAARKAFDSVDPSARWNEYCKAAALAVLREAGVGHFVTGLNAPAVPLREGPSDDAVDEPGVEGIQAPGQSGAGAPSPSQPEAGVGSAATGNEVAPFILDTRVGVLAIYKGPQRNCLSGISRDPDCVWMEQGVRDETGKWLIADSQMARAKEILEAANKAAAIQSSRLRVPRLTEETVQNAVDALVLRFDPLKCARAVLFAVGLEEEDKA